VCVPFFAAATKSQSDFQSRQVSGSPAERSTGGRVRSQQTFSQLILVVGGEGWYTQGAVRFWMIYP
jgi:hypothetical protein